MECLQHSWLLYEHFIVPRFLILLCSQYGNLSNFIHGTLIDVALHLIVSLRIPKMSFGFKTRTRESCDQLDIHHFIYQYYIFISIIIFWLWKYESHLLIEKIYFFPSSSFLSAAAFTAAIMAALTPPFSSCSTPLMVLPPGEQTWK